MKNPAWTAANTSLRQVLKVSPFQAIRFAVFSLKHIRYNHRKDKSQQDGKHFTFPTEKAPVSFRHSKRQTEENKCLYGQQALLAFQLTPDSTPTNAYLHCNQGPFGMQLIKENEERSKLV